MPLLSRTKIQQMKSTNILRDLLHTILGVIHPSKHLDHGKYLPPFHPRFRHGYEAVSLFSRIVAFNPKERVSHAKKGIPTPYGMTRQIMVLYKAMATAVQSYCSASSSTHEQSYARSGDSLRSQWLAALVNKDDVYEDLCSRSYLSA